MWEALELIVGLGNPGGEHLQDRHNAGFWLVDLLARAQGATFRRDKHLHSEITDVAIGSARVRLLKPQTYMNASGRAVTAALGFYKIAPERMLVAYDELDLEPGRAQLKFDGGHGGHNGVRDIAAHVGNDFWRLRLGVGHPGPGRKDAVVGYLLHRPPAEELERILEAVTASIEVLPVLLEKGPEHAKTQLHSRGSEPRKPSAEDAAED